MLVGMRQEMQELIGRQSERLVLATVTLCGAMQPSLVGLLVQLPPAHGLGILTPHSLGLYLLSAPAQGIFRSQRKLSMFCSTHSKLRALKNCTSALSEQTAPT